MFAISLVESVMPREESLVFRIGGTALTSTEVAAPMLSFSLSLTVWLISRAKFGEVRVGAARRCAPPPPPPRRPPPGAGGGAAGPGRRPRAPRPPGPGRGGGRG